MHLWKSDVLARSGVTDRLAVTDASRRSSPPVLIGWDLRVVRQAVQAAGRAGIPKRQADTKSGPAPHGISLRL